MQARRIFESQKKSGWFHLEIYITWKRCPCLEIYRVIFDCKFDFVFKHAFWNLAWQFFFSKSFHSKKIGIRLNSGVKDAIFSPLEHMFNSSIWNKKPKKKIGNFSVYFFLKSSAPRINPQKFSEMIKTKQFKIIYSLFIAHSFGKSTPNSWISLVIIIIIIIIAI